MSVLREIHANGWRVQLDLAGQVLHLEVPEFVIDLRGLRRQVGHCCRRHPPIHPTPVSAGTLLLKAKQFDDGLFAAAEIARPTGSRPVLGQSRAAAVPGRDACRRRRAGRKPGCSRPVNWATSGFRHTPRWNLLSGASLMTF